MVNSTILHIFCWLMLTRFNHIQSFDRLLNPQSKVTFPFWPSVTPKLLVTSTFHTFDVWIRIFNPKLRLFTQICWSHHALFIFIFCCLHPNCWDETHIKSDFRWICGNDLSTMTMMDIKHIFMDIRFQQVRSTGSLSCAFGTPWTGPMRCGSTSPRRGPWSKAYVEAPRMSWFSCMPCKQVGFPGGSSGIQWDPSKRR